MTSRVGRRVAVVGLVGAVGAIVLLTRGARGDHEKSPHEKADAETHGRHEEGQFLVTSPLRSDTVLTRDYVCQIRAIRHIEVRALERGYLEEVFVDEGKPVAKGQPLFQVMTALYQAELDKAKAEAEAARIEFENTKLLSEKSVVSANELALAKAKLDKAKADVMLGETHRRLTTVVAPFDGIMGLLHVRRGSLLDERELLTTLSDNSTMWVYFNVTEAEYLDYEVRSAGQAPEKAELILANGRRFEQVGSIETIAADFNNETGTIAFRATFPNPTGLLRHGETGKVRLTTSLKGALLVPQKVTFEVLDGKYVFVVDAKGVVTQRRVSIAHELPHLYVVDEGLAEGDRVLLEGLRRVQNGKEIRTRYLEPSQVIAQLEVPAN
ncbi:MAG: efflux RND transporter periplasmic adaptor subunit [Planctomycetota bacterium]